MKKQIILGVSLAFIFWILFTTYVLLIKPRLPGKQLYANTKAEMYTIQSLAQVYYDRHGKYSLNPIETCDAVNSLFSSTEIKIAIQKIQNINNTTVYCTTSQSEWALSFQLYGTTNYFCIDSTDYLDYGVVNKNGTCDH